VTRGAVVVACALAFAGCPGAARAAAATSPQVRALATAAPHDPAGRAREQARAVLAERRFHAATITSPLRGVRAWIGAQLRRLGRPVGDLFAWIARWFPGGAPLLAGVLGLLALAGATALALRLGARRLGTAPGRAAGGPEDREERMSAVRLRDLADGAERRGELDEALRLRFRAGLVELDSRELIELRPAVTNRELLRDVDSPTLDGLVAGFEAVAYGGRAADAEDVRGAREGWPRVAGEVVRR
jgi:hypothetical protein